MEDCTHYWLVPVQGSGGTIKVCKECREEQPLDPRTIDEMVPPMPRPKSHSGGGGRRSSPRSEAILFGWQDPTKSKSRRKK